jgi:hypothetical protein
MPGCRKPISGWHDVDDAGNRRRLHRLRQEICRTFQRSRLSLPLSIFDNIMIGNHKRIRAEEKRRAEQAEIAYRQMTEGWSAVAVGRPRAPQRRSDYEDCAAGISPHARLFITRSPAGIRRIAHHARKAGQPHPLFWTLSPTGNTRRAGDVRRKHTLFNCSILVVWRVQTDVRFSCCSRSVRAGDCS